MIDFNKGIELDATTDLKEKWYGLNSTKKCGCMTWLYKKYGRPLTVQEFYDSYINDIQSSEMDSRTFGRTQEQLLKIAIELMTKDNGRFELNDYLSYIYKKLFYDTIIGCKKEKQIKEYIESKGFKTKEPSFEDDIKLGVDLFAFRDNELKCIIQSKPNTFFLGNSNKSLINDRKKALSKQDKAKDKYGVPTYYIIYNKNTGEFIKNDIGTLAFRLTDLINQDGTT